MTRFILPIVFVGISIALFVVYVNPTYQTTKGLSAESASYDQTLYKSQQLLAKRDQLLNTKKNFSDDDLTKLEHVLPDNVDNIRLIIDINNIASRHNLALANVQLGEAKNTDSRSSLASGPATGPIGTAQVSFAVVAKYDNFLAFEEDLEHSLRIIDVDKISFKADLGDLNTYTMEIKTFWLH
jgi:Tfp pilus assembly protein PilO